MNQQMAAFSIGEWEIVIASYAYEVESSPVMDDQTFDLLCRRLSGL